jgi:hypothetical protein
MAACDPNPGWSVVVFNNKAIFEENTAKYNIVGFETITKNANIFGNYINNAEGGAFLQWFWKTDGGGTTGQGNYIHRNVITDTIGEKNAVGFNIAVHGTNTEGYFIYNNTFDNLNRGVSILGPNAMAFF